MRQGSDARQALSGRRIVRGEMSRDGIAASAPGERGVRDLGAAASSGHVRVFLHDGGARDATGGLDCALGGEAGALPPRR